MRAFLALALLLLLALGAGIYMRNSGYIAHYRPHEGAFLTAQVRQVQISLATHGFLSTVFEYAHYSDDTPGLLPDPKGMLQEIADSMPFDVCIKAKHESGSWEAGKCVNPVYEEEIVYTLPDGSKVQVEIGVYSHARASSRGARACARCKDPRRFIYPRVR